jgi:hypothetical protein
MYSEGHYTLHAASEDHPGLAQESAGPAVHRSERGLLLLRTFPLQFVSFPRKGLIKVGIVQAVYLLVGTALQYACVQLPLSTNPLQLATAEAFKSSKKVKLIRS